MVDGNKPNASRGRLYVFGGVVFIIWALLILLFLSVGTTRRNNRAIENARLVAEATGFKITETQQVIDVTETRYAELILESTDRAVSPTESFRPTLPAEFTPTPVEEEVIDFGGAAAERIHDLPPEDVVGTLATFGGLDRINQNYYPIRLWDLNGRNQMTEIDEVLINSIAIDPAGGSTMIYTRYTPATFDFSLERADFGRIQTQFVADVWTQAVPMLRPQQLTFSYDGSRMVFVATDLTTPTSEVFVYFFDVPPGMLPVRQLTNDDNNYYYPSISPDNTTIAAVRVDSTSFPPGTDLVLIDINSGEVTQLTDDGDAFIESHPRWLPDNNRIVFSAERQQEGQDPVSDIIIIGRDRDLTADLPVRSSFNDTNPVPSPDGRFLAFTSDRMANIPNVFIYDFETREMYQLTESADPRLPNFSGDWYQPNDNPPRAEGPLPQYNAPPAGSS